MEVRILTNASKDVSIYIFSGWNEKELETCLRKHWTKAVVIKAFDKEQISVSVQNRLGLYCKRGPHKRKYYVNRVANVKWPPLKNGLVHRVRVHLFLRSPKGDLFFTIVKGGAKVLLVGGRMEQNDSCHKDTAIRECKEETSILLEKKELGLWHRKSSKTRTHYYFAGIRFNGRVIHFYAIKKFPDYWTSCVSFTDEKEYYKIDSEILRTWKVDKEIDSIFLINCKHIFSSSLPRSLSRGLKNIFFPDLYKSVLDISK